MTEQYMHPDPPPAVDRLNKSEVAGLLRISIKTLERRMSNRQIAFIKDGRLVFFSRTDIADYQAGRKIRACGVAAR